MSRRYVSIALFLLALPIQSFSVWPLIPQETVTKTTEEEREAIRRGASIRKKMQLQYGGIQRLEKLVTVQRVVDVTLLVGEMEIPLRVNDYVDIKQPRRRLVSRNPDAPSDVGFDGQRSWMVTPPGSEPMAPMNPDVSLQDWLLDPHVLLANNLCEFLFSKQVENGEQLIVAIHDPLKGTLLAEMWVDATSFLVSRIVTKRKGKTVATVDLDDYRMVEGIPFAFRMTSHALADVESKTTLLQVVLNPKLPADFYKEPSP